MSQKWYNGVDTLPDTGDVTFDQFFAGRHKDPRFQGEKALCLAALEQAVQDFRKFAFTGAGAEDEEARAIFEEVEGWFQATDDPWPFSFENLCGSLDINSGWLRNQLYRWRATATSAPVSPFVRKKAHSHSSSKLKGVRA